MEVVPVVQWTGLCFERPVTIACLGMVQLRLVFTHPVPDVTDAGLHVPSCLIKLISCSLFF